MGHQVEKTVTGLVIRLEGGEVVERNGLAIFIPARGFYAVEGADVIRFPAPVNKRRAFGPGEVEKSQIYP